MSRFKEKLHKFRDKIDDEVDKLEDRVSRMGTAVATTWNPNHRHDEAHEKEQDRKRQAILDSHRYSSFADERDFNDVKWFIDGHDYFWALSEILEEAQDTIWICDWWLSPELYLRRPPSQYEEYRFDRVLKRAAERGVKIYVQVYKEVTASMTLNSKYTKHALEELHENIAVMRHPDHSGNELVYYWSHHEKIVVVDNAIACIGGLDICYGRWDTHSAPHADLHFTNVSGQVFPGQDFNDARVADFTLVDRWIGNEQARAELPRMPWHDIHTMIVGPAVMDVAQHFVERWNFTRDLKYKHSEQFRILDWPHDDPLWEQLQRHPHTARFRDIGFRHRVQSVHLDRRERGNMKVQVCRSVGDWSAGWLTECSIQNAYIQCIRESSHLIVIENQFFVSIPGSEAVVKNRIAAALVERILSAAQAGQKFKVIIIIPEIPCFSGDVKQSQSVSAIMGMQYRSINRGKDSMFGMISAAGYNPLDYISIFNLRNYDRIKYDPAVFAQMERDSGLSWPEVQAASARVNIGDNPPELEEKNNRTIRFKRMQYGEVLTASDPTDNTKKEQAKAEVIDLPENVAVAKEIIRRWEQSAPPGWDEVPASIARNTLQSGRSIHDELWLGSDQAEKQAFVSEELYIHSKLAIFDSRKVICGSANLNDRSQMGDRDSEIAIVCEDNELIETVMDGKKYMAGRFATTLQRQLLRQHLGLVPPQDVPGPITPAMRPVGIRNEYEFGTEEDRMVEDPLSDDFHNFLMETATTNAQIYQELFHCVPAAAVKTWAEYAAWISTKEPIGHLHDVDNVDLAYIKQQLARIRGHITLMPLDFLEDSDMVATTMSVNAITMPIYT